MRTGTDIGTSTGKGVGCVGIGGVSYIIQETDTVIDEFVEQGFIVIGIICALNHETGLVSCWRNRRFPMGQHSLGVPDYAHV